MPNKPYTGLPANHPLLQDPDARAAHDMIVARVNEMTTFVYGFAGKAPLEYIEGEEMVSDRDKVTIMNGHAAIRVIALEPGQFVARKDCIVEKPNA